MNRLSALQLTCFVFLSLFVSADALGQGVVPPGCGFVPAPGVSVEQTMSPASQRPYRFFIPADAPTPLPLVLDLHGSGGSAEGQARTSRLEALAGQEGPGPLPASTRRACTIPM